MSLALEPETFRPLGAGMGGGGYVFIDDTACVVDLNVMFTWFLEDESCGRCTTCRGGNQRMLEIFRRTSRGQAEDNDIARLQSLDASMQYSNCFHGGLLADDHAKHPSLLPRGVRRARARASLSREGLRRPHPLPRRAPV